MRLGAKREQAEDLLSRQLVEGHFGLDEFFRGLNDIYSGSTLEELDDFIYRYQRMYKEL